MLTRLALLAALTLPVAACDSEAMTDLRRNLGAGGAETEADLAGEVAAPAEPRGPVTSPLVEPIETGAAAPRAITTVEPVTYRTEAFIAGGAEPFWNVQIAGNSAVYRTSPEGAGRAIAVNRIPFAGGVEYIGVLNGRPFVVNLRPGTCQTEAGRLPFTARLTVTGEQRTGCAGAGTVAAPQAAAADAPATSG